jgi:hypothetical protein
MTPSVNAVMTKIRTRLQEESDAVAWGPDMTQMAPTNHSKGAPGDGGAENETDIPDALDRYLGGIAQNLIDNYGMSETSAFAKITSTARSLASAGTLPSMPSDSSDDQEIAEWMGKAASIAFAQHVFKDVGGGSDAT